MEGIARAADVRAWFYAPSACTKGRDANLKDPGGDFDNTLFFRLIESDGHEDAGIRDDIHADNCTICVPIHQESHSLRDTNVPECNLDTV